jgi:Ni/Fe-hydrogenase 1 B-type cytochrome subunit
MKRKEKIKFDKIPQFRAYIWEFPVRFTHWINAFCILSLSVTGYYIGNPFMHATSPDQYIMGWIRFIHFTSAYIFLMMLIIRVYWSLVGNRFASFVEFFPFSAKRRKGFIHAAKFYLLIKKNPPHVAGHAPLASSTYFILFLLFLFEIASGFTIYSVGKTGPIWSILSGGLLNFMYLPTIRQWHHIIMYVILIFVPIHIYATWYMDPHERNGLVSSMFSGFKFLDKEHLEE